MLTIETQPAHSPSRHGNCPILRPMRPDFFQTSSPESADPAAQIRAGISRPQAQISPWYFYDQVGSSLFDVITVLPDYYPTRTEAAIIDEHLPAMAEATGLDGCSIIDLGAGNCEKAPKLFGHLQPRQYVPVDISVDYLRGVVTQLQLQYADIEMVGVGTDFSRNLVLPDSVQKEHRLFFYPGSSLGNFDRDTAIQLLIQIREQIRGGGAVWIGIDLVKDKETLERAYDDELGVTEAFNRNILRNANHIAGTDFNPREWRHVAFFNEHSSRIEMHLEATKATTVSWQEGSRSFDKAERIHTENSHKYTEGTFRELLAQAGLRSVGMWTDTNQWFAFFAAVSA